MGRASHIPLSGGVAGGRVRVAPRGVFPSHSAQLQSLPLCGGSGGAGEAVCLGPPRRWVVLGPPAGDGISQLVDEHPPPKTE